MNESTPIVTQVRLTVADTLVIADPCYVDEDDGDSGLEIVDKYQRDDSFHDWGVVLPRCAGDWIGEIDMQTRDRVSVLRLTKTGGHPNHDYEPVGLCSVDSGQMFATALENLPIDYGALLDQYSLNREHCLAAGGGIVSSTGYGDGVYHCYVALDRDDLPVGVEVRFVEEDEYEYCQVCGMNHEGAPCEELETCPKCGDAHEEDQLDADGLCFSCRDE